MRGEALEVLDEDLLHDGRVRDGKPGGGHVVEAVNPAVLLSSLHVQLGVVDLFGEYFVAYNWSAWGPAVGGWGGGSMFSCRPLTWCRFHGPLPKRRVGGITAGTPHFSTCMENGCKQSVGRMILLVSAKICATNYPFA